MTRGKLGSRSARRLGSKSIRRLLRLSGPTRRHSIRTVSTPSFPRNTRRSGGHTSPALPEVTCGCGLETCPTQSEVRYGKNTSQSWPSQQDSMTLLAFERVTAGNQSRASWATTLGKDEEPTPGRVWRRLQERETAEMRCDRQRIHCFRQVRRSAYQADFIGRRRLAQERRQLLRHGA